MRAERLFASGNRVGESPVWDESTGQLYWVDIPACKIFRATLDRDPECYRRTSAVGSIALATHGLVAATKEGFVAVNFDRHSERMLAPVAGEFADMRMNDGACDRQGRFWSGSMKIIAAAGDPAGELFRLTAGTAVAVLGGLVVQNGLAWSPDGTTMYLSDSHPSVHTVWAFDFDAVAGIPSRRRILITGRELGGRPDGATVDADGCYWTAANDGGQIVRVTPAGKVDRRIDIPTSKPTNICFGGGGLRTMFITSMKRPDDDDGESGNVFAVETDVAGIAETRYRP